MVCPRSVALLLCMRGASPGETEQGLRKGETLHLTVDAETAVRPVNRRVMGIAFFDLWDYVPIYSRTTGAWILNERCGQGDRGPPRPVLADILARSWQQSEGLDLKSAIDRVAQLCGRFGIRQEDFVLELEKAGTLPVYQSQSMGSRCPVFARERLRFPVVGGLQRALRPRRPA